MTENIPPLPETSGPPEPTGAGPAAGWGVRIIFWALFLYAVGLALLVFEDYLSHTFIQ